MIDVELEQMADDMNRRLSYQGFSLEQYLKMVNKTMDDFKTENRDEAEKSVRTRLVLEAIFNDAKMKIEDKEVDEKIAELAKAYGRKEEELKENDVLIENIKIATLYSIHPKANNVKDKCCCFFTKNYTLNCM